MPHKFFATYPQSLARCLSAFVFPFVYYRRYLRIARLLNFTSSFVIGFKGVLTSSLFGYLIKVPKRGLCSYLFSTNQSSCWIRWYADDPISGSEPASGSSFRGTYCLLGCHRQHVTKTEFR